MTTLFQNFLLIIVRTHRDNGFCRQHPATDTCFYDPFITAWLLMVQSVYFVLSITWKFCTCSRLIVFLGGFKITHIRRLVNEASLLYYQCGYSSDYAIALVKIGVKLLHGRGPESR